MFKELALSRLIATTTVVALIIVDSIIGLQPIIVPFWVELAQRYKAITTVSSQNRGKSLR